MDPYIYVRYILIRDQYLLNKDMIFESIKDQTMHRSKHALDKLIHKYCSAKKPFFNNSLVSKFQEKSWARYYFPRANGAKRRSGRKPGARVTNSALAFTYIRIMRCYIAQWHSGIKSRPIRHFLCHGRW